MRSTSSRSESRCLLHILHTFSCRYAMITPPSDYACGAICHGIMSCAAETGLFSLPGCHLCLHSLTTCTSVAILKSDVVVCVQHLGKQQAGAQSWQYKQLLDALNDVAHHEIDAWLSQHHHLSEPFVARTISQQLPSGTRLCPQPLLQLVIPTGTPPTDLHRPVCRMWLLAYRHLHS